jgi:hypothetical protein
VQKVLQALFSRPEISEKKPNLVKIIVNYLYVGKMHMIYQNAQKNMLYILVSISCIVKQFEPCPK